jgi:hypothetical protein
MAALGGLALALCLMFFTDIMALFRPVRAAAAAPHAHANPR